MRRFKSALTAVAALAAFAGVGTAAAPAQAATYCTTKGQKYFCAYGIASTQLDNGTTEQFVVGSDHAVWTNWSYPDGSWNGWVSMGGWVQSQVTIGHFQGGSLSYFTIEAIGSDGNVWFRSARLQRLVEPLAGELQRLAERPAVPVTVVAGRQRP